MIKKHSEIHFVVQQCHTPACKAMCHEQNITDVYSNVAKEIFLLRWKIYLNICFFNWRGKQTFPDTLLPDCEIWQAGEFRVWLWLCQETPQEFFSLGEALSWCWMEIHVVRSRCTPVPQWQRWHDHRQRRGSYPRHSQQRQHRQHLGTPSLGLSADWLCPPPWCWQSEG